MSEIEYIGYHGTNEHNAKNIVRTKEIFLSRRDDDWLGTGAYFFIDGVGNPIYNSINYAKFIQRHKKIKVIQILFRDNEESVLNLNTDEWLRLFDKVRDKYIQSFIGKNNEYGDASIYKSQLSFDNFIINLMCENMNLSAVIMNRYVNFYKSFDRDIQSSHIANTTMLCVKDISKIIEYNVWEDDANVK